MESVIIKPETFTRTRLPKKERMRKALAYPFAVKRERNNRSLYHFIVCFWSEISNEKFKSNWHIEKVLCPELEKIAYRVANNLPKEYDLIFNVPPGTTKTMTVSIMFPVWCWTKWFWMRFITASHSAPLSLESAEHSRDLIRSDKFKIMYPELSIKEDKDAKGNFKIVKEVQVSGQAPYIIQGGNRYSTSVAGSVMGFHGHINIWDDLLDPLQAISEVQLATANYFLDHVLSMRKVDKAVTTMIGIMQRLHQDDPTGHALAKKEKKIRHISLPGEIRNYREQVKPQELIKYYKDDLLDPVRMSWKILLEDMKPDLGQYGYAGQVGQKPTPPGGGMFKVDHFNIITTLPAEVNFVQTVRYWDKAGSEATGAYTVGVKMSKLLDDHRTGLPRFVVHDVKRGQWASEERERIILQTAQADGGNVQVGVEQEPGSGGKESAEGTIRNLAGFSCYADRPTGDKAFRADPYSVQVNNGNVMLLHGDWNHEFVEEHRNFPFSTYKDQVDASSGGFNRLAAKRIARRIT